MNRHVRHTSPLRGILPVENRVVSALDLVRYAGLAFMLMAGTLPLTAAAERGKKYEQLADQSNPVLMEQAVADLEDGKLEDAAQALSIVAARKPRDASVQTLLALTYHRASDRNAGNLDLATAGYDIALSAEPGNFWAAAFAGRIAYERGEYERATSRFAQAILVRPNDRQAMLAMAASAYMDGDADLASLAADRAVVLNKGAAEEPMALRLAALAGTAASRDKTSAIQLDALAELDANLATATATRVAQLQQTRAVDAVAPVDSQPQTQSAGQDGDQIMVDVAIVLSQRTRRERIGLNLLDGLNLNYGYGRNYVNTRTTLQGGDPVTTAQRVITRAITVPELNYNLNLFNRNGQSYSLVARPSLTAYRGETSEFFVGQTLKVAVSGVNFSSLEQIDIGIEMKVTPIEITSERTRVRVETSRSFLTDDGAGQFRESLSTFRQRVAATAEVGFGETLILSGLSESVDDSTYSETPLLGDLPLVGSAFNSRSKNARRDAALMLITPSLPGRLPGRPINSVDATGKLARLWTEVVDPGSNGTDIAARLSRTRMFTRTQPSDAPLSWPSPGQQDAEAIRDLVVPGMD